jgi:cytochrome P450
MREAIPWLPTRDPILGHVREFREDPLAFVRTASAYGDLVRWRIGPFPVYMVTAPELVQELLVSQAPKFYKSRSTKAALRETLGQGLLLSDGSLWKRQRRLVQPAFHTRRITAYADTMVAFTLQVADRWTDGEMVDIGHEMMELTLRVVAKSLFDTEMSEDVARIGEVATVGQEIANHRLNQVFALPHWLPTEENRTGRRIVAQLDEVLRPMMAARRASGEDRGDLLSMMLLAQDDDGGNMNDRQVRDEAATLFLAGHETTAVAMTWTWTWTWALLSQHPDVEQRLHAELQSVLGGRAPGAADLPQLPCLERVVQESMRLFPPAWITSRGAIEAVDLGRYHLKKGSTVFVSPYGLHHDARWFTEPERFDPDRFTPQREAAVARYAYLPFGAGPRVCIGNSFAMMEARLLLATLAQRVRLRLSPAVSLQPAPLITLRPRRAIRMQVLARELVAWAQPA